MGLLDKGTESTSTTTTTVQEIVNVGDIGFTNDAALAFVNELSKSFTATQGGQNELYAKIFGQLGDEYKQLIGGQNDLLQQSVGNRPISSPQLGIGLTSPSKDAAPSLLDNKFLIGVVAIGTLVVVLGKRRK